MLRKLLATVATAMVVAGGLATAPTANAGGNPYWPDARYNWCPGGGSTAQWFCEGISYADGTRWQQVYVWAPPFVWIGFWNGPVCIQFTGHPAPPLAPPWGCGRG